MSGINESAAPTSSPIHQLLPELLTEIFIKAISIPGVDEGLNNRWAYIAVPYLLSQVCQYWRSVAIATPALWSVQPTVGLYTLRSSTKNPNTLFLNSHLLRSRDAPIHVALNSDRIYYRNEEADPNNMAVLAIIGQSHRWKTLIIEGMMSTPLFQALRTIDQLPILTSLKLHDRRSFNQPKTAPHGLSIFKNSPLLHYVIINGIASELPPLNIRTYIGLPYSMDGLEPIKAKLESCTLRGPLGRVWPPTNNIIFPALSVLCVDNRNQIYRTSNGFPPLDDITTPVLQELEIGGYALSPEEVIDSAISLISRSSITSLRRLTLGVGIGGDGRLISLFCLMPNLEELNLLNLPATISKSLIHSDGKHPLLPRLQKLTISQSWHSAEDVSVLLTIQQSRSRAVTTNPAILYMEPIRLVFPDLFHCHLNQRRLEGRSAIPLERILSRRAWLLWSFLGRSPDVMMKYKVSGLKVNWKSWLCNDVSKLNNFFSEIENFNFESGILHYTQFHLIMRDISLLPQDVFPTDEQYHFRSRASALLQQWIPILLLDVKSRNWVKDETGKVLQNIEWYDDGRSHPEALDIIFR